MVDLKILRQQKTKKNYKPTEKEYSQEISLTFYPKAKVSKCHLSIENTSSLYFCVQVCMAPYSMVVYLLKRLKSSPFHLISATYPDSSL